MKPMQARREPGNRDRQTRSRGPIHGDATVQPIWARRADPVRVSGVRSPGGPLFRPSTRPGDLCRGCDQANRRKGLEHKSANMGIRVRHFIQRAAHD
jgi:hypothetical protein